MISYLNIKNIAIISELELKLEDGLNILSGETGAGKSIVIDSVNFVLGDRADRSLIRYGENFARVEAVFEKIKNFQEIKEILTDAGIDCDDEQVIVSRTMTQDRSECRINTKIVPLALLRSVVALLVDTHTQNENQNLLKISNHLKILDGYTPAVTEIKTPYRALLGEYKALKAEIDSYANQEERQREIDMLQYQIEEIEKAQIQEGEEEELKQKRTLFYNGQKIITALRAAHEALNGSSGFGAASAIDEASSELSKIASYDIGINNLIERLEQCSAEIDDIGDTLQDKLSADNLENLDIDKIEKRIEEIRLLGKKYGKTSEDINAFFVRATERLDLLTNAEARLEKLEKRRVELEKELTAYADKLHILRQKSAESFCRAIGENIAELGMKNAIFDVRLDKIADSCADYNENGYDEVEFMLAPNVGEPPKPLAKIASGGEMSRFMLALKNVIAEIDNVDTLIFDEIDTGISGVIARVVAEKLYNIATSRQVIAITHLPQLGSMADVNYLIEKRVIDEKTMTFVKRLQENEVYKELMRLSGAIENSEIGYNNAVELKQKANQYKQKVKK